MGLSPREYAAGYHEAWDVYLHERRQWHADRNLTYTPKHEDNDLIAFMLQYRYTYQAKTACRICQEEIATATLEGRDPFACPPEIRQKLRDMGVQMNPDIVVPKPHLTADVQLSIANTVKKVKENSHLWGDLGILPK